MMDQYKDKTFHFIGMGGAGMSPIAKILLEQGFRVQGSDLKESINTIRLRELGAKVFFGHDAAHVREADCVVVSGAIGEDNVELVAARQSQCKVFIRAEMLNMMMMSFHRKVAVAGTHGKTTTSSMMTRVLGEAGRKPTFLVGSEMNDYGGNASLGGETYFVAESDESDGSFLCIEPNIAIVTNIEPEHMDFFRTEENLMSHFRSFILGTIQRGGYVVLNYDDARLRDIAAELSPKDVYYFSAEMSSEPVFVSAADIQATSQGTCFEWSSLGKVLDKVSLQGHGIHHVYNALAVAAVGLVEKLDPAVISRGLAAFSGTKRRMQLVGEVNDIQIYDDYAHHPTEIKVTLDGLKEGFDRRIFCVFQPHRYSRTEGLLTEFSACFGSATGVFVTDIYGANEEKKEGLSGQNVVDHIECEGQLKTAVYIAKKSDVAHEILPLLASGDQVVTMGAGDIHTTAREIFVQLKQKYLG